MQLKPFEAGRYSDETIVIRNPENGRQELFTEDEFEVVKFIKENEDESLLGLLLPNIGIAKKNHIVICLKVLSSLKRIGLVDIFGLTGKKPASNTGTLEMELQRARFELKGLRAPAAAMVTVAERTLGRLGAAPLLVLTIVGAVTAFVAFPFDSVEAALRVEGVSYLRLVLCLFIAASCGMVFRSLLQAAFVRAMGRDTHDAAIALRGPLVSLEIDRREVNLGGFQARLQMSLIGLLAPMALAGLVTGLALGDHLSALTAFYLFCGATGASLVLACPFFALDGADVLHVIFRRAKLRESVSEEIRNVFRSKGSLTPPQMIGLVATFAWLLVWLDSLRSLWDLLAVAVAEDFSAPLTPFHLVGAVIALALLAAAILFPLVLFAWRFASDRFGRRHLQVEKSKVREMLTFEERMAALERIPLFAYLNDQERLSLLNEMQPAFYANGEYLVHQGEVGQEFFVLVKGGANAMFTNMSGKSSYLADLREGDAFGEIALIDDVPRTASIVSDGGCIALVLKKDGFDRFAESLGSVDRVKTMIRLTSFFRRHPLFSKLGARDQAMLIDSFLFHAVSQGEEVPEGEENFYVVYSGTIRVDTGDDSADTQLTADDCFGYANALRARYFATEGAGLLAVRREEFYSLIWEKLVERPELFV